MHGQSEDDAGSCSLNQLMHGHPIASAMDLWADTVDPRKKVNYKRCATCKEFILAKAGKKYCPACKYALHEEGRAERNSKQNEKKHALGAG